MEKVKNLVKGSIEYKSMIKGQEGAERYVKQELELAKKDLRTAESNLAEIKKLKRILNKRYKLKQKLRKKRNSEQAFL